MKNIGDKAPEVLGINEKGEEIRLSAYKGKDSTVFLSERQYIGVHGTGMQSARQLFRTA